MCLSVCLSVCVCSLLRYRLNAFFPPTSQSRMSKLFRDSESLGKVMERSGLRFENFYNNDQEVIQQGSGGFVFQHNYKASPVSFAYKGWKITAQKKFFFCCTFCITIMIFLVLMLLSALVERCFVSRMRGFFFPFFLKKKIQGKEGQY